MEEKQLTSIQETEIVEKIVNKWNQIVTSFENTTIKLCLIIQEYLKDYPEETIKGVLKKVMSHPDIKRTVSVGRIWQGFRLIRRRPDLIEYASNPEKSEIKPFVKKDGSIFWEFYFELYKAPLSDAMLLMLEIEGKKDNWSYRDLKGKISDAKSELKEPLGYEAVKQEKYELIKKLIAICKDLKLEELKKVVAFAVEIK